jgi:hypothetical protein
MRTVLLGTDFMYDNSGNLKPIEVNTSVGWNGYDKLESDEETLDLTGLVSFIEEHNFTKVEYIGNLDSFFKHLTGSLSIPCEIHRQNPTSITIPNIEDNDETLIIRSAYDTTAIVDEQYCKDKINFLNLIKNSTFSHEFAYIDEDDNLVNNITAIHDNGNHPNFLLKAVLPDYDKNIYPKLYKITTQEELDNLLSTITEGYFLMPYYYNDKNIQEDHVSIIRSLNLLFPPDLESIHLGAYHKICENAVHGNAEYENTELKPEFREQYVTGTKRIFKPKLDDTDLVEMADGTFKTAADLEVGDLLKTIDIPNPFEVDNRDDLVNYRISYDELVAGTTYSTNAITFKKRISTRAHIVVLKFTDGTDWLDYAASNYLVEREGEIRFLQSQELIAGDKFILIDTSTPDTVSFIEKTIESTEGSMKFFNGWDITVERAHLFLTKESEDTSSSYVAIEHNYISCYKFDDNCAQCWQYGCAACSKYQCCNFFSLWNPWGFCNICC